MQNTNLMGEYEGKVRKPLGYLQKLNYCIRFLQGSGLKNAEKLVIELESIKEKGLKLGISLAQMNYFYDVVQKLNLEKVFLGKYDKSTILLELTEIENVCDGIVEKYRSQFARYVSEVGTLGVVG